MLQGSVISAVYWRNVKSYFSGIIGYLFIVVFVVTGAILAFSSLFFANNLANLDQLTNWFPLLLLFIVPAITMGTWAEEKKQGTDELLFTLPASDFEVLFGKYLSVLTVYTVALLFSSMHVAVLCYIGNPDLELMFATYLGYWLAGAALLAAGMFASSLTGNTPVAFVLGAIICSIPVFGPSILSGLGGAFAYITQLFSEKSDVSYLLSADSFFQNYSVGYQLEDFTRGIVPLSGFLYFISIAVVFLYLNLVIIGRRHWAGGKNGSSMNWQFLVRSFALVVAMFSVNLLFAETTIRADLTAENVYSFSNVSKNVVKGVKPDQPITIQAFVSPEVPQQYEGQRKHLVGLLRQYDVIGKNNIDVRIVNVKPYSNEATEALQFGITPRPTVTDIDGRSIQTEVYLGAVITSSVDEVIIPFFEAGKSVEYELTSAIRTVSAEGRPKIGILKTDLNIGGGFDMNTFQQIQEWQIVTELKKQFDVETVSPDSPINEEKYDVLIAALPSSLTVPQMDNFVTYVKAGHPVLIFDDPFPFNSSPGWTPQSLQLAPRLPKPAPRQQRNPMMMQQPPQAPPKADDGKLTSLLNILEIAWQYDEVVYDRDNSHPRFSEMRPELLFISPKKKVSEAFNSKSNITNGLKEMFLFFSGTIREREGTQYEFKRLLQTGASNSGLIGWQALTENRGALPNYASDQYAHCVAAEIKSKADAKDAKMHAIFVSDIDVISDHVFRIAAQEEFDLKLDNIIFVLNCVDELSGNSEMIELRKKRARNRTLTRVEKLTTTFVEEREKENEKAKEAAEKELKDFEESLTKKIDDLNNDKTIDNRTKSQLASNLLATKMRQMSVRKEEIDQQTEANVKLIKSKSEQKIREIKGQIRFFSVALPPIPAILMGIFVFFLQASRERRNIDPERLVQK